MHVKIAVVAGVGIATLGYLYWRSGPGAKPADSPGAKLLTTTTVTKPKPRARKTSSNAPVDTIAPEEPFTQLQLESAAALGFSNNASGAAADDEASSRALNEDLQYIGLGG
jgi:hypothetical protein